MNISIHVLREEDDAGSFTKITCRSIFLSTSSARRTTAIPFSSVAPIVFLSTSSARRTTCDCDLGQAAIKISIHVLREEDDSPSALTRARSKSFLSTSSARRTTTLCARFFSRCAYFYPRPPRGGRLDLAILFLPP